MTATLLCLLTTNETGNLERVSLECLGAARCLKEKSGGGLVVGVIGQPPAAGLATAGADRFLLAGGDPFAFSRYATDAAAGSALVRAAGATMVIAPATPRIQRFLPGLAARLGGVADTHVTALDFTDGRMVATRWYYRQRIETTFTRPEGTLWCLSLESGCAPALETGPAAAFESIAVDPTPTRTTVKGMEGAGSGTRTIRPEADLLFVAGAGWTKKQPDGTVKTDRAASLILDFVNRAKASLGSSKSMVDLGAEGHAVLPFLTHQHQVGQTGSTPRHPKGLATCCHGEEPHVVGWRFVKERRAINSDPNCGWAHGKADVLYVADAFEVMEKVNAML